MKKNQKTGLGESLLLQRTDAAEPPDVSSVPTSEAPERLERPAVAPQTPERKTGERPEAPKQIDVPRHRRTLYLDEDVDEQLQLVAGIEQKQRSEIVTEILRRHLPTYSVERVAPDATDAVA